MADISQITLPDNNVYYIKDATARSNISDLSAAMPTKTSDLTNDSGFITSSSLPVAATATPLVDGTAAVGSSAKYAREDHVHPHDTAKQDTLVSGTNIKTINNESILGSGNISITAGSSGVTSFNGATGAITLNVRNSTGSGSIAEGQITYSEMTGSDGSSSIIEHKNIASGTNSHAEGYESTASGNYSHVEGYTSEASGYCSHAEGQRGIAFGNSSHAEGILTTATGDYSHAEGRGTIANYQSMHVFGEYNSLVVIEAEEGQDPDYRNGYVEMVGNGTSTSIRHDARTLDWNGNEVLAGTVTATGFIGDGSQLTNLPVGMTLLWTNASPQSKFASQNITLDGSVASTYDGLITFGYEFDGGGRLTQAVAIGENNRTSLHCWATTTNNRNGMREFYYFTSGGNTVLYFGNCQYNGGTQNDYCVPYRIYGLKGVRAS